MAGGPQYGAVVFRLDYGPGADEPEQFGCNVTTGDIGEPCASGESLDEVFEQLPITFLADSHDRIPQRVEHCVR